MTEESNQDEVSYGVKFQEACASGQVETATKLLDEFPDLVWYRDPKTGESPLHWAASTGSAQLIRKLFENRHPWNVLDFEGNSAGSFAEKGGHTEVYSLIVDEGVRAELILSVLEESQKIAEKSTDLPEIPNADYLKMPLSYSEEKLLDAEGNGVMMGWEAPLMELHAEAIAPSEGLHVLNIGFGLGLIDAELQKRKPASHTIVEAHPDVYAHMLKLGWNSKPGVRILFGRWQDQFEAISSQAYDGIFFDTFGEYYRDLKEFHEMVPNILNNNGVYSFFNGLGGDVKLFHDAYCQIAQLHLAELGLETTFTQVEIDPASAKIWDGVKRRYWKLATYHLPTCKFLL